MNLINLNRLITARDRAGLTQGQAANLLRVSPYAVLHIESGDRDPTDEEVLAFAELYKVSPDWLRGDPRNIDPRDKRIQAIAQGLQNPEDLKEVLDILASMPSEQKGDRSQPQSEDPLDSIDPTVAEAIRRANADAPPCLKDRSVPMPHEPAIRHSENARREEIDGFVHWTED